jgi:hypothetical protein
MFFFTYNCKTIYNVLYKETFTTLKLREVAREKNPTKKCLRVAIQINILKLHEPYMFKAIRMYLHHTSLNIPPRNNAVARHFTGMCQRDNLIKPALSSLRISYRGGALVIGVEHSFWC